MSTEDKDLSPEEIKVNSILGEASLKIENIDNQIKNLPSDKGPELRPPGTPPNRPFGTKARNKSTLQAERDEVETTARADASKVIESSSPEAQKKLGAKIQDWQKKDADKNKDIITPVQGELLEKKSNSISSMQDQLLKKRNLNEQKDQDGPKNPAQASEPSQSKGANPQPMKWSAKFNQTLEYNNIPGNNDSSVTKSVASPEIDIDKD